MDVVLNADMTVLIQFGDNPTLTLQPERDLIFQCATSFLLPLILPIFAGF